MTDRPPSTLATVLRVASFVWHHPANRSRRLRAAVRAVRFQLRGRLLGRATLTPIGDHSRMWAPLHFNAAAMVVYANPPNWNEMVAWRRFLRPGDLFVDVGANVGAYSMWAADCGAEVIALEPDPAAHRWLVRNAEMAAAPVTVLDAAAAQVAGLVAMTAGRDSMNRLLMRADGADAKQSVRAVALDDIVGDRRVRGVKIDVEGAERLVLEGARRALSERRIDLLQIEWNHMSLECLGETREPVARLLAELGYELVVPGYDGELAPLAAGTAPSDIFSRPAGAVPAC